MREREREREREKEREREISTQKNKKKPHATLHFYQKYFKFDFCNQLDGLEKINEELKIIMIKLFFDRTKHVVANHSQNVRGSSVC